MYKDTSSEQYHLPEGNAVFVPYKYMNTVWATQATFFALPSTHHCPVIRDSMVCKVCPTLLLLINNRNVTPDHVTTSLFLYPLLCTVKPCYLDHTRNKTKSVMFWKRLFIMTYCWHFLYETCYLDQQYPLVVNLAREVSHNNRTKVYYKRHLYDTCIVPQLPQNKYC